MAQRYTPNLLAGAVVYVMTRKADAATAKLFMRLMRIMVGRQADIVPA